MYPIAEDIKTINLGFTVFYLLLAPNFARPKLPVPFDCDLKFLAYVPTLRYFKSACPPVEIDLTAYYIFDWCLFNTNSSSLDDLLGGGKLYERWPHNNWTFLYKSSKRLKEENFSMIIDFYFAFSSRHIKAINNTLALSYYKGISSTLSRTYFKISECLRCFPF